MISGSDSLPTIQIPDEDDRYDVRVEGFNPANFADGVKRVSRELVIVEIRTGEVAVDLWTFVYNYKTQKWNIAGLYRCGIFTYLESQNFAKRYRSDQTSTFLIQGDAIIKPVIDTVIRDNLKDYIQANYKMLEVDHLTATGEGLFEIYNRQQHLVINPKNLEGLTTHTQPFLKDTKGVCYIPYSNYIVKVTAEGTSKLPYSALNNYCIWDSQVIKRDYDPKAQGKESQFYMFLNNITDCQPDRLRAFRTAIGYLLHHHNNPTEGQAIICYDEVLTSNFIPEGGTGKGVFAKAIQQIRPVAIIDGKKFDPDDRFCFQPINQDTAVLWLDDPVVVHPKPERRFNLERFFSLLTEGWSIEKKHEHAFRIPASEGPKLLISSNVVMPNQGSSNRRRQFIIEFSNHYQRQIHSGNEKPIQAEHGSIFFSDDWSIEEWQRFDQFMIDCVRQYLFEGLQPYELSCTDQNWLRQTMGENFYKWVTTYDTTGLMPGVIYNRITLFNDYKSYAFLADDCVLTL